MDKIGENIRKLRALHSLPQEYMASNLQMSQGNYARIENGDVAVSTKRLRQIAAVLGYTPEFIINFDINRLNRLFEQKEKAIKLLNLNISPEIKELYEARICILENQVKELKRKMNYQQQEEYEQSEMVTYFEESGINQEENYQTTNDLKAQKINRTQAEFI